MKSTSVFILFSFLGYISFAQTLYFPPVSGNAWDTLSLASLGWCEERIEDMYDMLDDNNTKAFIVLKDGKIVLEKYFGSFVQDSVWYWASAGKSLTACLVGIAQEEGFLRISDRTSDYLGPGWTDCTTEQEDLITIRHQLTMTTGLDDNVPDHYCTLDTCLQYKADAGTRWAYHNGPYTLLDDIMESATGQNLNTYFQQKVRIPTGITGLFVQTGYNNVFYSKARSMARFGLLILNRGNWNGTQVITDTAYFNDMINTSQMLNQSYGYLWWLNGKPSYMLPGLQFVFPGSLMPHAPDDMLAALGKNGQYINVVPGLNMVVIRMGNAPDGSDVSVTLNDMIWEHLNQLECGTTGVEDREGLLPKVTLYPNPVNDGFTIDMDGEEFDVSVYDMRGIRVYHQSGCHGRCKIVMESGPGVYWVRVGDGGDRVQSRRLVIY
jgi:CubicO group peptidase (beta-lactamase class C family)